MSDKGKQFLNDDISKKYEIKVVREKCCENEVVRIDGTWYHVHYATSGNQHAATRNLSLKMLFFQGNELAVFFDSPILRNFKSDGWINTLKEIITDERFNMDHATALYPYSQFEGVDEAIELKFPEINGNLFFDSSKCMDVENDSSRKKGMSVSIV